MPLPTAPTSPARTHQRTRTTPSSAGLPDPRPVTGFVADYTEDDAHSYITVTLDAPCIIRDPMWSAVDCSDGTSIGPVPGKALSPTQIVFKFDDILPRAVCFIDVPYQDMQVQNFQGGFVRPGPRWFRSPL